MTVVTENYFGLFSELDYGISKMQFAKNKKTKKQTKKTNQHQMHYLIWPQHILKMRKLKLKKWQVQLFN